MSLNNERNSSVSSSGSSTTSPTEKKNADFSISAILSDETGGRKARGTPVSIRERRASAGMVLSPPGPNALMSTPSRYNSYHYSSPHSSSRFTPSVTTPPAHWTGSLNQSLSSSPFNMGLLLLSSSPLSTDSSRQDRLDIEASEKEAEDGLTCDDSLGMLSTVALYHSELSGSEGEEGRTGERGETKTAAVVTTVSDGVAQMRLASSSDTIDSTLSADDHRSTPPPPSSPSYHSSKTRKGSTPFILRRNNKRRRQLTETFAQSAGTSTSGSEKCIIEPSRAANSLQPPSSAAHTENTSTPLDVAFLSPTSTQRSPRNSNSFSPSIFLSRPANTSTSGTSRSLHTGDDIPSTLPVSEVGDVERSREEDSSTANASSAQTSTFATSTPLTSTPVKHNKENASGFHLPSTNLSPSESGGGTKRPRLADTAAPYVYETSSGSDSEVPVKKGRSRSQALRRRNKARAQLSPLLENACSPIAKSENRPPSSLLTANFPTSSSVASLDAKKPAAPAAPKPQHPPLTPATMHPPIPLSYPQVPPVPFPFSCNPLPAQLSPHQPNLCLGMMPVVTNPLFTTIPVSPLSPPHAPYFIPPRLPVIRACTATAGLLQPPNPFFSYCNTPHGPYSHHPSSTTAAGNGVIQKWGGSPFSAHMEKTGQIQSVPPWFIFEQNRPEGKRLRLTEAINKSLSETPSHNPKLPVGWTKYACGQTDDQILLTQKARLFLQSGRRQLTFDNINT